MIEKTASFFYIFIALIFIAFAAGFLMFSGRIAESKNEDTLKMADEILVKFKGNDGINVVRLARSEDYYEILKSFDDNSEIEYAEPNYLYKAAIIPSDTYYNEQWYLEKIKAPEAWNEVRTAGNIVIAVLDSGVQIDHPDLRDNIWQSSDEIPDNNIDDDKNGFIDDVNGWDFVNNTADPSPKFKEGFTEAGILHGTIVAGIAAASGNNAAGVTGVAWKTKIMPLKVLGDAGEGNTNDVVKAIDYAIANGADVINLSFIGFGFSRSLENAIKRAYDAGIVVVAAAGNEQGEEGGYSLDNTPMYPACHDGDKGENRVIGVAATDTIDQKAIFSSFGFNCVDISAPGLSFYGTTVYSPSHQRDGEYFNKYYDGYWSGTSMAAPIVSAAAALIEEVNPSFSRRRVVRTLLKTSDNINRLNPNYLNQLGEGRLNLYAAVLDAKNALGEKTVKLLLAPFSNHTGLIKTTDEDGAAGAEFKAYADNFLGGVSIASGDVNGDGENEIITGAGPGGGPHVRIFNERGELESQFFAYAEHFRGGVNVAACDLDGNGTDEIITGAGFGGGPHVRIFDQYGNVKGQFFAYNKNFRGGVYAVCGDVDGDGESEIVTGTGKSGGPQVRIFNANGTVEGQFFAYDKNFRGGVRVALGDIDGGARGKSLEIITAPGPGGGPHIRIFDNYANVRMQFFAYNKNFRGGVSVAAGDIDNDGLAEIITGAGPGGAPHVRVFEPNSRLLGSFYAYDDQFSGGVNVGTIEIKNYELRITN
ncbi:MAG: S8 family serine peptidase [Actinobacteria bacterium]|nr:S8 family serine peptidase [Actinomycetota bacterium]